LSNRTFNVSERERNPQTYPQYCRQEAKGGVTILPVLL